jgi:hypothetical protein
MSRLPLPKLLAAALLTASLVNAVWSVKQQYHWPVVTMDDWSRLQQDLTRARAVLGQLPEGHVEHRIEEASDTYDPMAFYRLQYILAPTILQQGKTNYNYLLIEFWTSKQVKAQPGLTLIEDFGHGIGLYRRSFQ